MPTRPPAHLVNTSAVAEGVVQRIAERIGDKSERIHEIALAAAVGSDENRQRAETHIARADTFVIADGYAGY